MTTLLYSLAAFAGLFLVFGPLERSFQPRPQKVFRKEWGTDALFFFGQYLVWGGMVVSVLVALSSVSKMLPIDGMRSAIAAQPIWLQAIEIVLLGDLIVYWGHRLSHSIDFLWRFHRVHHTAERLDWLAAHREHPIDGLFTQIWINGPAILLGFPIVAIAGVVAFRGLWAIFIHSNVRIPVGPLKYIFGSPELHHWHHEKSRGDSCNFANLMPLMDLIFGTYHEPGSEPENYGTFERVPKNYFAQLLFPFKGLTKRRFRRIQSTERID